jgi:L-asparaginase
MTGEIFDLLSPDLVDGVVIEALGAGNIPPSASQKLESLIKDGLPVVLVSRCFNGIAEPVYGYEGGGVDLVKKGVFFVKELNAQKARIKLLIALNAGLAGQELKNYIEG